MAGFHQSGATNIKSRALMSISTSRYAVAPSFRSESKPQSVTSWSSSAAANGPPQTSADKVFTLFCDLGIRIPAGYLRDLPTYCCSYFVLKELRFSLRRLSNLVIYNAFTSCVFFRKYIFEKRNINNTCKCNTFTSRVFLENISLNK